MSKPFYLIWKNEIIDESDSQSDASYMASEYTMAYQGSVTVTQRPPAKLLKEWQA